MRKLIAFNQVTLDGIMQGPGGPEEDPRTGFTHGGWIAGYGDDTLFRAISKRIAGSDLILGRWTYDVFAGYWPKQSNDIAKAFNKAVKYVATNRSDSLDWKGTVRLSGDVVGEVRRLKESDGPDLNIWGSWKLLQTLIAAGLIDEYINIVYPVVLGKGKRLFESDVPPSRLALVETFSTPQGVLFNTYRSVGPY